MGNGLNEVEPMQNDVFIKGVVCEVFYDLGLFDEERLTEIKKKLSPEAGELLTTLPRNSCSVRLIGSGRGQTLEQVIAYPFFPSHLSFPIKPGEIVWIFSPRPGTLNPSETYWISRVSTTVTMEDVNYTPQTRANSPLVPPNAAGKGSSKFIPNFPNSTPSGGKLLGQSDEDRLEGLMPLTNIVDTSESYKNFSPEPVPKFTKRIGDFVIQGSNNTLISLGEDRGWKYSDNMAEVRQQSNAVKFDPVDFAGTVDIVAGRGRYLPDPTEKTVAGAGATGTACATTQNKRFMSDGTTPQVENNKNPYVNEFPPPNPAQGDPNFVSDAARIYVSMKTSGDINFGINQDGSSAAQSWSKIKDYTPEVSGVDDADDEDAKPGEREAPDVKNLGGDGIDDRMSTGFEAAIESVNEAAYIVAKADQVRIIARKQDAEGDAIPEINGSIRLIKEGKKNEDLAVVVLLPDGTIQISGSKIYMGRAGDDDGRDAGPGPGGSEPYVRYSDLKAWWEAFIADFDTFLNSCENNATPGYGNPNVPIKTAAKAFRAQLDATHKPDISTVQSERIFGE